MTNNDLNQIGALMDKKLKTLEGELKKKISATEEKLDKKISLVEEKLRTEMLVSDKRVTDNISSFMEDTLLPWINNRFDETADKADIERIERKLDRVIDTNQDHERRIKDIESVPVVACELKRKKPKL